MLVVAPAREKSACGHGLSITKPLSLELVNEDFYRLDDGTPTDCVYLALNTLYKDVRPDLVVSGINIGCNMGEDVTYSGTVAGAMEGAIFGIPSIAISQLIDKKSDLSTATHTLDFTLAKASIYDTGKSATYGDQLLTLSTCDYSQKNGRFAVVAKEVKD